MIVDTVTLLLTALGGAVVAALAGFIGAWIQGRQEHSKWLREKRIARYEEFLEAVADARFLKSIGKIDEFKMALAKSSTAGANVLLVGPDELYEIASQVHAELVAFGDEDRPRSIYYALRGEFIVKARASLGIPKNGNGNPEPLRR